MARVNIDPKASIRPTLPEGRYGESEKAVLERLEMRPPPWEGEDGEPQLHFQVRVQHADVGIVRADSYQDIKQFSGSRAESWMKQLGCEDPTTGFDTDDFQGMEVIAELGVRKYRTREGEERETNTLRNIYKK